MDSSSFGGNRAAHAWLLSVALAGCVFQACDNGSGGAAATPSEAPSDALVAQYESLMRAHDEVMPMSAEVARAERMLEASGLESDEVARAEARLAAADDAMMTWMYNNETAAEVHERLGAKTAAQHLRIREREIVAIGDSMRAAIDYAESLLPQ